ncbi:MAG: cache domain-containing protein, partial [Thermoguttaceae bacterium]
MLSFKSVQAIIAASCIFLTVMIIFLLGFLLSNSILTDMHIYGDRRIEENRDRRRASLGEIFYRESTTIEIIAKSLECIPKLDDKLDIIKDYTKKEEYDSMCIADLNGNAMTTRDMEVDISKRKYFNDILQNPRTVISEPVPSIVDGDENTIVMIAAPLFENGKLIGLVAGAYNTKYISKKLVAPYSGWGHDLLVNSDGLVFAQTQGCPNHPSIGHDLAGVFADSSDLAKVRSDMLAQQNGHLDFKYNGDKWSVLYAPVGINDWYIFSLVPLSAISPYKNLTAMRGELVAVIIIIGLLSAGAGYWAFTRQRIGRKLLLTFWGLVLIACAAGGVGGVQLINIYSAYSKAMGRYSSELSNLGQIALSISNTRAELNDAIILDDSIKRSKACDKVRESAMKTDAYRAALKMQLQDTAIAKQWADLETHLKKLSDMETNILELATSSEQQNRKIALEIATYDYSQSVYQVLEKLQHLIEINMADTTKTDDSLRNDSMLAVLFVLTITIAALILSIILAALTARSIRLPLNELETVAEKIANYQTDF